MPRRKGATRAMSTMSVSFSEGQKNLSGGLNRMRDKLDRIANVAIESDAEDGGAFGDFSAGLEDFDSLPEVPDQSLSGDTATSLGEFESALL